MKNNLHKILLSAAALLNVTVAFSEELPPPPPPTVPPGLPIDTGIAVLLLGALGIAFYCFRNCFTKKASK